MAGSIGWQASQTWQKIMGMVSALSQLEPHSDFEKRLFSQIRDLAEAFKADQGLQDFFCKIEEQLALGQQRLEAILRLTMPSPQEYLCLLSVTERVHLSSEAGQQRLEVFRDVAEKIQLQADFLKLLKESDPFNVNKFFPKESNALGSLVIQMIQSIAEPLNSQPYRPQAIIETLRRIWEQGDKTGEAAACLRVIAREGCLPTLDLLINHFQVHYEAACEELINARFTAGNQTSALLSQVLMLYQAHRKALLEGAPLVKFLRAILENPQFKEFDSFIQQASLQTLTLMMGQEDRGDLLIDPRWALEDEVVRRQLGIEAIRQLAEEERRRRLERVPLSAARKSEREQLLGSSIDKERQVLAELVRDINSQRPPATVTSQFDARYVLPISSRSLDAADLINTVDDDTSGRNTPELC